MNQQSITPMLAPLRTPEAIGWWPPAPGWWVLGLLALALLLLAFRWAWHFHRRGAPLRSAARELERIETGDLDCAQRAQALARLQRRIAIRIAGRGACAGLTGSAWTDFLNRLPPGDGEFFSSDLAELAYRAEVREREISDLIEATRLWLEKLERPA
ncbi:MAG: DUF4381 domain-containing protein [Halieaceae bacterium]|nr:DUF4381 domain-containing protein [Halieaceae bacterium]